MATLTVSVSDNTKEWIDERVRSGDFKSTEDYLAELVERDRTLTTTDDEDIELLREIVDEARAGGIGSLTLSDIHAEAVRITKERGTYRE